MPLRTHTPNQDVSQTKKLGSIVRNELLSRESHLFQLLRIRGGHFGARDSYWWRIQVIKGVFCSERNNLCAYTKAWEARLDRHHVASLLDRVDNGLHVKRLDRSKVDDLCLYTVLALELFCGNQRLTDTSREGDDCEILARALNFGLAKLEQSSQHKELCLSSAISYWNDKVVFLRRFAHGE